MSNFDPDAMIQRFRERAAAVKKRPLPPVAGEERQAFLRSRSSISRTSPSSAMPRPRSKTASSRCASISAHLINADLIDAPVALSDPPARLLDCASQCGCGSAGRASPCQGEGREFESRHPLQRNPWSAAPSRAADPRLGQHIGDSRVVHVGMHSGHQVRIVASAVTRCSCPAPCCRCGRWCARPCRGSWR